MAVARVLTEARAVEERLLTDDRDAADHPARDLPVWVACSAPCFSKCSARLDDARDCDAPDSDRPDTERATDRTGDARRAADPRLEAADARVEREATDRADAERAERERAERADWDCRERTDAGPGGAPPVPVSSRDLASTRASFSWRERPDRAEARDPAADAAAEADDRREATEADDEAARGAWDPFAFAAADPRDRADVTEAAEEDRAGGAAEADRPPPCCDARECCERPDTEPWVLMAGTDRETGGGCGWRELRAAPPTPTLGGGGCWLCWWSGGWSSYYKSSQRENVAGCCRLAILGVSLLQVE